MRTVSKALLALCLFWNVGAVARQPTSYLPDPDLTPGDVFDVTVTDICTPGYSKTVRVVPIVNPIRRQLIENRAMLLLDV